MDASLGAALTLGFMLGAAHALEPDHVAAIGTLVSEQRRVRVSCLLGAFWGLGHTAALLAAGAAVIVFRVAMPPSMERGLEMSVALLSIGLGARLLVRLAGGLALHRHNHAHGGRAHVHYHLHFRSAEPHAHDGPEHMHLAAIGGRPVLVGVLHGLAGSGALAVGAVGAISSPPLGMAYLLTFGLGSTAGMLSLSGLIGVPFARIPGALAAPRARLALAALRALAGAASIAVGVALAARLGG